MQRVDGGNDAYCPAGHRQPIHRLSAHGNERIIKRTAAVLQQVEHDIAHDQGRNHHREIDRGAHNGPAYKLGVEEQRKGQTENILEQGAAEAIEDGVEEDRLDIGVLKEFTVIVEAHILVVGQVAGPVGKGNTDTLEEGIYHKNAKQQDCRQIEQVDDLIVSAHALTPFDEKTGGRTAARFPLYIALDYFCSYFSRKLVSM